MVEAGKAHPDRTCLPGTSTPGLDPPIKRFIWDLTYACPLRCQHCYSESGRRPARMLDRKAMRRVIELIVAARPMRISLSGGEPLLVPWWHEAASRLTAAGVPVTIFTSGSVRVDPPALAESVASVAVSVDGGTADVHDRIRGKSGSFSRAMETLTALDAFKGDRRRAPEDCYSFGVDCTVTRSAFDELEGLVEEVTKRFRHLDFVRFGAVVPEGLAQEEDFAARELLDEELLSALTRAQQRLAAKAHNQARISVTDSRYFLPTSLLAEESATIAHIEPDGQLRAFTNYEAKVGNVLTEPLEVLWARAHEWRRDPFVAATLGSIKSQADWARATRILDRRYGSAEDRARIARRGPTV